MRLQDDERITKLREFGLSEYASRAYLALLQLGPTDARAVSRLARVPVAKIYSTLDQLAERGLCDIEPGPPKRFRPVAFDRFLETLAAEHLEQARAVEEMKETLASLYRMTPSPVADDRGAFQVLRGRRATMDKLRSLHEAHPASVILHTADGFVRRGAIFSLLDGAHRGGSRVRLLARIAPDTVEQLARLAAFAEVRSKDDGMPNILVALFDTRAALVVHFIPDDAHSTRGNDVALYTTEEAIVGALSAFVESEWSRAATFEDERARIAAGDPVPSWEILPPEEALPSLARKATDSPAPAIYSSGIRLSLAEPEIPAAWPGLVARAGFPVRLLADLSDATELAVAERLAQHGIEVRHDPGASLRFSGEIVMGPWAVLTMRTDRTTMQPRAIATNDGRFRRALLGQLEGWWAAATTIADRRAELERYGSSTAEERRIAFDEVFDSAGYTVSLFDRDLRILFVNRYAAAQRNMTPEQLIGRLAEEVAPGYEKTVRAAAVRKVFATGRPSRLVARFEGTDRWFETDFRPVGESRVLVLAREITRERRAVQAAEEARERALPFDTFFAHSQDAISVLDRDFRIVFVNPAAAAMRGGVPGDFEGKLVRDLDPDWERTQRSEIYRRAFQTNEPQSETLDYRGKWMRIELRPLSNGLLLSVARDITQELRERTSAQLAAALADLAADERGLGVTWREAQSAETSFGPSYRHLIGFAPDVPITRDAVLALIHPDDRERALAEIARRDTADDPTPFEHRIVRPDGQVRLIRTTMRRVSVEGGRYVLSTSEDVTDERAHEHEVNVTRRIDELAAEQEGIGIAWRERDVEETHANAAFRRLFGFRDDEPITKKALLERIHPADRERASGVHRAPETTGGTVRSQQRVLRPDGSVRRIEVVRTEITVDGRRYLVSTHRDITDAVPASRRMGWIEMDIETGQVWRSPSVLAMMGLGPEHATSPVRWDGVHPDDVAKLRAAVDHVRVFGGEVTVEHRSRRPDGSWVRFRTTYSTRPEADGKPRVLMATTEEALDAQDQ